MNQALHAKVEIPECLLALTESSKLHPRDRMAAAFTDVGLAFNFGV